MLFRSDKAKAGHYAVGQFNINNLEWTKSILLTAQELNSPVILGVSEGAGKYMTGFETVAAMVKAMDKELGITVPVALHLDHGTYEGCYKCIKAGFTSIMFDGSHYAIEDESDFTKAMTMWLSSEQSKLDAIEAFKSVEGKTQWENLDAKKTAVINDFNTSMKSEGVEIGRAHV